MATAAPGPGFLLPVVRKISYNRDYSQLINNSALVSAENKVQVATCAVGNYSLKRHGPVHGRLFHRNLKLIVSLATRRMQIISE